MRLPASEVKYIGTSDLPSEFAWGAGLTMIEGQQLGCMSGTHGDFVTATVPEAGERSLFNNRWAIFNPAEVLEEMRQSMELEPNSVK